MIVETQYFLDTTKYSYDEKYKKLFNEMNISNISFSRGYSPSIKEQSLERTFVINNEFVNITYRTKRLPLFIFKDSNFKQEILFYEKEDFLSTSFKEILDLSLENLMKSSRWRDFSPLYDELLLRDEPSREFVEYLDYCIGVQEEVFLSRHIQILSTKLTTISNEERLSIEVLSKDKKTTLTLNSDLYLFFYFSDSKKIENPHFAETSILPNISAAQKNIILKKLNYFIFEIRDIFISGEALKYFKQTKEYKMRTLYDSDFKNKWSLKKPLK